jgi:hypothetical protein
MPEKLAKLGLDAAIAPLERATIEDALVLEEGNGIAEIRASVRV